MSKTPWIIGAVLAGAATVGTLAGAVDAWDGWRLPRPVMTPELWRVSEEQQQNKVDILILQKKAASDELTKIQLIKSDYELQKKLVPDYITDEIQKKEQEIDDYNDQILQIKDKIE